MDCAKQWKAIVLISQGTVEKLETGEESRLIFEKDKMALHRISAASKCVHVDEIYQIGVVDSNQKVVPTRMPHFRQRLPVWTR